MSDKQSEQEQARALTIQRRLEAAARLAEAFSVSGSPITVVLGSQAKPAVPTLRLVPGAVEAERTEG